MPELRLNIATNDWVIIATERARRPHEFIKGNKEERHCPPFLATCPFCTGAEAEQTCKDIASIKDHEGNWLVRSVPNKFPALSFTGEPETIDKGVYHTMNGVGAHEVIIESPVHNLTTAHYRTSHLEKIIEMYKARYLDLSRDPRLAHIIIFKNHGEGAGTSLEHPHSQIVATPIVPTQVMGRLRSAREYHGKNGECVFCRMAAEELKAKKRIVAENAHFVTIEPYASFSPFHTWILPKKHRSSFGQIAKEEIKGLAAILKDILARFYYGVGDPDYNYCIRSSPLAEKEDEYFHWYIAIVPRISRPAGFEMGSGMFINTSLPEECARFLRDVALPSH
ncbi:MAG: galactose-1-phosphate uridylyltransferase [Candidatus Eremiobacteraeota bacterium]|nr:galactose-1-phosphate uridylyltransferase [Candidatus Eremiobacteraeota bacterium]